MNAQHGSRALGAAGIGVVLSLAACSPPPDQSGRVTAAGPAQSQADLSRPAAPQQNGPKLAYRHSLALEMPRAAIESRFQRARNACLDDPALACVLVSSNIELGNDRLPGYPRATLNVRLPHGRVEGFTDSMTAPLPGEAPSRTAITSRSTNAEDMTQAIADVDRRLSQLTNLRDRLTELAKRSDAEVDDLIKVEKELAQTQAQIEALTGQQLHLADQVATEALSISFMSETPVIAPSNPIVLTIRNAGEVLSRNVAEALAVAIGIGPWLVLAGLLGTLLRFTWRRLRRKPQVSGA